MAIEGCGLTVPNPHEIYDTKTDDIDFVNLIMNHVKCELTQAYVKIKSDENGKANPRVDWLDDWGASVDLKLTVENDGTFAPGVLLKPPPPFSLGIGASATTKATRIEDSAHIYAFSDLLDEAKEKAATGNVQIVEEYEKAHGCHIYNGIFITSDLDIDRFLKKYMEITGLPDTVLPTNQNVFYSTLNYTVTFVATFDANVTPMWTFKTVSVNTSGKLLDASNTKTSNLVITFSKSTQATANTPASLLPEGQAANLAAMIGQAVASAIQANSH